MKQKHVVRSAVAVLGITVVAAVPAAMAKGTQPRVSVRVEGLSKTVLPDKTVSGKAGKLKRNGHSYGGDTALEALNAATHGKWAGSDSSYGWYVTSILGQKAPNKNDYWAFYVNGKYASKGLAETTLKRGQKLVLAMESDKGKTPKLLSVTVPGSVTKGKKFAAKVKYYTAAGKLKPFSDATVRFAGKTVRPGSGAYAESTGTVTLKATKAGKFTVKVSDSGYIRDEATITVKK